MTFPELLTKLTETSQVDDKHLIFFKSMNELKKFRVDYISTFRKFSSDSYNILKHPKLGTIFLCLMNRFYTCGQTPTSIIFYDCTIADCTIADYKNNNFIEDIRMHQSNPNVSTYFLTAKEISEQ